jgi:Type III secretion protein (HpaP)
MSQSRSIRFAQIRLVTDSNRIEPLRDIVRMPTVRAKIKNWVAPAAHTISTDTITLPEVNDLNEAEQSLGRYDAPPTSEAKAAKHDEPSTNGNEERIEPIHESMPEPAQSAPWQTSISPALDDADQKVSIISTMSLVRSIVADEGIRAIADSIASICNDEANDRNGPWYFEMHHATHMLPMTILSIELSCGEILLRFVSSDPTSVRLISDRKQDLKTQLENRLRPARSVQIEIISD